MYGPRRNQSLGFVDKVIKWIRSGNELKIAHAKLDKINYILLKELNNILFLKQAKHRELAGRLEALNPDNVLLRGYSITRVLPSRQVVKSSKTIMIQQQVEIQLSSGALLCRVEGKNPHGEENV